MCCLTTGRAARTVKAYTTPTAAAAPAAAGAAAAAAASGWDLPVSQHRAREAGNDAARTATATTAAAAARGIQQQQ
ncbi:hypothetical protein ACSSS7_001940 [Eimeria intestinalis]